MFPKQSYSKVLTPTKLIFLSAELPKITELSIALSKESFKTEIKYPFYP